ncbi:multiheme c-type cytochrome [Thalassotalea sp. ND16A]|uniref:multiheme c-type cytochrome n=1 Tax=Thalassotalea sp. ND16A TaxID=1535422 RepID=UPI00051A78A8|nr:multiheme c-type cytochrome [Thalassotalea sp. ND16A]KGJ89238.1 hypothetical protein ND16A_2131 [Thalassotalea sp. ND16A]
MHLFSKIIVPIAILTSTFISSIVFAQTEQQCVACHQEQVSGWQQSDHAKSMAIADKNSVLAPFTEEVAEHYGQKAKFYRQSKQFKVDISYGKSIDTYTVDYTFGHYPLQQYLVETKQGGYQVLPFAWDSRVKDEGGQRWYHNYQDEEIKPADRLHWRQPLQNWNGMCADCHSDGLKRNYDLDKNQFSSTFTNINVGCLSCHGAMSESHLSQQQNKQSPTVATKQGAWHRKAGQNTAKWQGEKRDNSFMEQCFACHALRAPLTDGIDPKKAFLDQFSPQFIQSPNYHVDGQIKEEVYVYGSFLQSKMYANGVNCIDCHDQHTMKIKIAGNGLCLQCHASEVFDKPEHHNHQANSDGAQCVNCHMTENRYMGVDDRRDHSFKIPRPDLSKKFASPNACTSCHQQKDNDWAVAMLKNWQVKPRADSVSRQHFWTIKNGLPITIEQHLAIIADENLDIMSRATALQMLGQSTEQLSAPLLKPYVTHKEELLRLASANVGVLVHPGFRAELLAPLLDDSLKAIRVAAARALADVYIPEAVVASFDQAFKELTLANQLSSWRGEGRLNLASMAMAKNDLKSTEQAYKQAIEVEPYFDAVYSNLAELYRSQGKDNQVASVLNKGINQVPTSALLHYAYGLHFVRQKKLPKAIELFKKAMVLAPQDPQYPYIYTLALDGNGETDKAILLLTDYVKRYPQNQQLVELGLSFSQKRQNRQAFEYFMSLRQD